MVPIQVGQATFLLVVLSRRKQRACDLGKETDKELEVEEVLWAGHCPWPWHWVAALWSAR